VKEWLVWILLGVVVDWVGTRCRNAKRDCVVCKRGVTNVDVCILILVPIALVAKGVSGSQVVAVLKLNQ